MPDARTVPFDLLLCPLDGEPLLPAGASWQCAAGHSFDVAADGYLNLLPVQHKRSRDPGDSKAMVAARRRFLAAGHYRPIAQAVTKRLLPVLPRRAVCLDAGCGEGYYLRELAAAVPPGSQLALLGLDISKWAVQAAARQFRASRWVVGSNAHLPVPDASCDALLCLFGFPVQAEFARVVRAGGVVLLVDAGADHLRELRTLLYPTLKAARAPASTAPPGFVIAAQERLRYVLPLQGQAQIADLLVMTPHFYRASAAGREAALALDAIELTVEVDLCLWRRQ